MPDHTVRGKMVRLRGAEANVRQDGSVHVNSARQWSPEEADPGWVLTEAQALDLYQVLADVMEYGPGDGTGTTEGQSERSAERAEAEA